MLTFAFAVFVVSLAGIVALFCVKYWEAHRARVLLPDLRARADRRARHLKELFFAARADLAKLPPLLIRLARFFVQEVALAFAAAARAAERSARSVAELVSSKRTFERRETRSEFLKKVAEHKSGGEERGAGNAGAEHGGSSG